LAPGDLKAFVFAQLDDVKLAHNTFSDDALELIIRSIFRGLLRRLRNLCVSALLETLRDQKQVVGLEPVNRVLMQPHWRKEHDLEPK